MIFIKQHFKQEVPQNKNNHNVNDIFKIPIFYNTNVQKLNDNIINDLELVESINAEESPIYENIFKPSNKLSLQVIQQISNYYTTDVEYLTETQQLTTQINSTELNTINDTHKFRDFEINDIVSLWEEIKEDTGFCEKYLYIDWAFAKNINNNSQLLQDTETDTKKLTKKIDKIQSTNANNDLLYDKIHEINNQMNELTALIQ
jgi:hypothetical protein